MSGASGISGTAPGQHGSIAGRASIRRLVPGARSGSIDSRGYDASWAALVNGWRRRRCHADRLFYLPNTEPAAHDSASRAHRSTMLALGRDAERALTVELDVRRNRAATIAAATVVSVTDEVAVARGLRAQPSGASSPRVGGEAEAHVAGQDPAVAEA